MKKATAQTAYMYLDEQQRYKHLVESMGMVIPGNGLPKAGILEEGFAHIDAAAIAQTTLITLFPEQYEKRRSWLEARLENDDTDAVIESMIPFVVIEKDEDGQELIRLSKAHKEYLLIRAVCEAVGTDLLGEQQVTADEAFMQGQTYLDLSRYTGDRIAHRKIVEVLGPHRAKMLFNAPSHIENIDGFFKLIFTDSQDYRNFP